MEPITAIVRNSTSFDVQVGHHKLICDQPFGNGGQDTGPSPPQFFFAGLASCVGYYVVQYLKTRKYPYEGVRVEVNANIVKPPAHFGNVEVRVELPEELDERHKQGVERAANFCTLSNTLERQIDIHTVFDYKN